VLLVRTLRMLAAGEAAPCDDARRCPGSLTAIAWGAAIAIVLIAALVDAMIRAPAEPPAHAR
jgi:hypothetical protein